VAWQALGSAATLASALWISWRLGLVAQGHFGFAKSWFDAAAAIASLGLPQGLLHLQYRLKVPGGAMRPALARGLAVLGVGSLAAASILFATGQTLAAAVVASLPFAVGHLLARSLLLAKSGIVIFGAVTALPALLVLAGALAFGVLGHARGFEVLLLTAAILAGAVSMTLAWRSAGRVAIATWPRRELWRTSLQSWLQAALGALLAAGVLSTVVWTGHGGAELGAASLGLHLYQVFVMAGNYLAPLLFDQLARQAVPTLHRRAWPRFVLAVIVMLLGLSLAGIAVSLVNEQVAPWLLPASLMLPTGLAALAARIAGTVLLARSAYTELSLQAAWRLALALGLTALGLQWLPSAAAVAAALLATELATWWRSSQLTRKVA
jgi:hypothetical protein